MSQSPLDTFLDSSPPLKDFALRFKGHYKASSVWTLEGGCLLFTSWMVYYLLFVSPEVRGILDLIVLIFFFIGVGLFGATSSLFSKLSKTFTDPSSPSSSSNWTSYLTMANRYIFMALSFIPGLYFAFKYEHFIMTPYLFIHIGTIAYFFYKRFREFELEPFLIGLGMSAGLYMVGPVLRTILGQGFGGFLETMLDLGLAVAFLLRLPQKYLPPNMMFGLKLIKYLMCFLSWQTWYILMIFATWSNLGAAAQAAAETYKAIPVPTRDNRRDASSRTN